MAALEASAVVMREGPLLDFEDLDTFVLLGEGEQGALHQELAQLAPEAHEGLWQRTLSVAGSQLEAPATEATLTGLRAAAVLLDSFAEVCLDATRVRILPPSFAEAASRCQDLLLSIPDAHIQALIARALEKICVDSFDGCEDFYGGVLMFLLGRCIESRATNADVARLYRVRTLLAEMDWEHSSIESLKVQIVRCVASATFLRSQHGPDLLAIFFTVNASFTMDVHNTVKSQVMHCRPAALERYASGLFKAWKSSEGGSRVLIEQCVQDWVVLAIRTARKSADRARALLEEIHRHHHEEDVNDLLCRLYGPVFWRSLKVANWQVRENAARLLQYIFPLIPKEAGVAEKEHELSKQLRLLRETLEDPAEPVRRVGVSAACAILKNYWDMLPAPEIAELMAVLMNRCAHDKKAPQVRAAVAEGFSWILENALSHPTMGAVLPQTSDLLNDRSPVVRVAFVGLLHSVSHCRGVTVSSIVSNEALLLQLASEHAEGQAERLQRGLQQGDKGCEVAAGEPKASSEVVARQLSKLIAPSLFQQDLVQQVARCHYLMQHWPLALLALLTNLQDVVPLPERMKLAAALFRFSLREAADQRQAQQPASTKLVASMLRVVGVLLEGAATEPGSSLGKKSKGGKKQKQGDNGFSKELQDFVYEHIREKDFIHLLRSADDQGPESLQDDLLYALAALDPKRLPRTLQFVKRQLQQACEGASVLGLPALLRTAARWQLLPALEGAWTRLMEASKCLAQHEAVGADAAGAVAVLEAALREPEVRTALLRQAQMVSSLRSLAASLASSLETAWAAGLAPRAGRIKARAAATGTPLLGPGSVAWPRLLGLATRMLLHLEYRPSAGQCEQSGGEALESAEVVLTRLAATLSSSATREILDSLEGDATPPSVKRRKTGKKAAHDSSGHLPAEGELEAVLRLHERLLEALNAALALSPLQRAAAKDAAPAEGSPSSVLLLSARSLEECMWRWASLADAAKGGATHRSEAWSSVGRLLQQMAYTEVPSSEPVSALQRLLARADETLPAEVDLRQVLQAVISRLEYEPQLLQFLSRSLSGKQEEQHPRVVEALEAILPSFRHLRCKLMPKEFGTEAPPSPDPDRRRILATPTPQKSGLPPTAATELDIDSESIACLKSSSLSSMLGLGVVEGEDVN